jgi:hypothetical protein
LCVSSTASSFSIRPQSSLILPAALLHVRAVTVIVDSFKIITLLFTLSLDLDDQMNIIILRNLIYDQMTAKLSGIIARNKLKKKKNEKNKVYSLTSFKNKKKKKSSASFKNDNAKIECSYCK